MGRDSSGRGRGRGRSNGRDSKGGRGSGKSSQPKSLTSKQKLKREDAKFDIGPVATRAVEYEKNFRFLLNYIQRIYKGGADIVSSLEERKHVDFDALRPVAKTSQAATDAERQAEQILLDEENKELGKAHAKRVSLYEDNKRRIYAVLWNQCTEALQQRIEASDDFETKIKNDHVKLMDAIEEHCLISSQDHHYDMKVVFDALMNLNYLKMGKDESVPEFYRRAHTAKEIVEKSLKRLGVLFVWTPSSKRRRKLALVEKAPLPSPMTIEQQLLTATWRTFSFSGRTSQSLDH